MEGEGDASPFRYHLELTPRQLKVTHTALRSLLDDFGHDEAEVHALIQEVLAKLPDEHAIRAIRLDQDEPKGAEELLAEAPSTEASEPEASEPDEPPSGPHEALPPPGGDEPPPSVA